MEDLSNSKDPVIAITSNDWHLWPKAPIFRSSEVNWLDVQAGYLQQLVDLLPPPPIDVPIIVAGDIFDKCDPQSSFISWCIDNVPECWVVAGQHDLPNHRLQDLDKSGLGLLIKLRICKLLRPQIPTQINDYLVGYGYSWGQTVEPVKKDPKDDRVHLAVVHAFIWTKNTGHIGVSEDSRLSSWFPKLQGYTAAVFGDNHKSFINTKSGPCSILNNGTFMIRRRDEIDHKPSVGLIHRSGKISRHFLDTSKDQYLDVSGLEEELKNEVGEEAVEFIEELERLGDQGLDYVTVVRRWCEDKGVGSKVRDLMLDWCKQ